jgi:hypothetical protein
MPGLTIPCPGLRRPAAPRIAPARDFRFDRARTDQENSVSPLRPGLLLAALAAPLAGCASPGQTSAVQPAPAPVVVTTLPPAPGVVVATAGRPTTPSFPQHWDGSYQGRSVLVRAASPACPPSRRGVIEIGDSTIFFPYQVDTIFTTAVRNDGTMHGVAGDTHLDGQIVGDRLTMTIRSPVCETWYSARYVWNRSWPP